MDVFISDRPVYPGMPIIIFILGGKFPCSISAYQSRKYLGYVGT